MGGSIHSLPRFNWQFVRKDDWYQIYKNQMGELAEKHLIGNDPKLNQVEELDIYYYRYMTKKPLVKVYRADYQSSSDFCSNHRNITVFTQYIPYRLIDTRNLSHEQGLYTLCQSLIGFHQLFAKLGPFAVDDTLIGFNMEGHVKVWYNSQYAKNHFQMNSIILMSTLNPHQFDQRMTSRMESDMAETIWNTVDQHALFRNQFRDQVSALENINFYNLKDLVDQQIKKMEYVPPALRFQDKFGIVSSSRVQLKESTLKQGSSGQRTSLVNKLR